jgi:hypothetical protein
MKKKPPLDKWIDSRPSPERGMPGVAPIDANAFSQRAGEIIAKAIALSDEKPKRAQDRSIATSTRTTAQASVHPQPSAPALSLDGKLTRYRSR